MENDAREALAGVFHDPTERYDGRIEFSIQAIPMVMDESDRENVAYVCYPGNKYDSSIQKYVSNINKYILDAVSESITINTISINNSESKALSGMINGTSYVAIDSESVRSVATSIETEMSERMNDVVGEFDDTDADGDGLADVYEESGMKTSNNCIIYTDSNSDDTDGDGYSDYEEMGGAPNEEGIFSLVSDPNNPASYPGALDDTNYIIVDSLDYYSFSEDKLYEIYEKPIRVIYPDGHNAMLTDSNGKEICGLDNVYGSDVNELSDLEAGAIITKATVQCLGAGGVFPYASMFLWQYIENTEYIHEYNAKYFLPISENMRDGMAQDVYNIVDAALNHIEEGETIMLSTSNAGSGSGTGVNCGSSVETVLSNVETFLAIGAADTACTARICYKEGYLYIDLKYFVLDYYDWDCAKVYPIPLVSDNEMWRLCRDGQAKFYQNVGIAEFHLVTPYVEEFGNIPDYVASLIKLESKIEIPTYILDEMDYETEQEYIKQLMQPI